MTMLLLMVLLELRSILVLHSDLAGMQYVGNSGKAFLACPHLPYLQTFDIVYSTRRWCTRGIAKRHRMSLKMGHNLVSGGLL
jgi:hypothetical protein